LVKLKDFFATSKVVNKGQSFCAGVPCTFLEMLSMFDLDNQQCFLKITMKASVEAAYGPPFYMNFIITLWWKLFQLRHLSKLILEYFKLV